MLILLTFPKLRAVVGRFPRVAEGQTQDVVASEDVALTDCQDEWRDEMLLELLQALGWYKMALPNRQQFRALVEGRIGRPEVRDDQS